LAQGANDQARLVGVGEEGREADGDQSFRRAAVGEQGSEGEQPPCRMIRRADTRTPEELLDLIEAKGRDVADALATLRATLGGE